MANNIFISYDLNTPGQNYNNLIEQIKNLGNWAHVQHSLWHVKSNLNATQIRDALLRHIDKNDNLVVIDTSNNAISWSNVSTAVAQHLNSTWNA
ncbi:CRISPR-associated protein Cas2 [Aeromonas media]|uniref:CRISPR-associated protein Cas2 n=1 Tax=Aeromonas media TaxID=651 RepID=UPI0029DB09E3|nr:CRISPR-associated protein Cas2 [Aeromonas media]MDX7898431.1 CRISPR-associated protein Cas2 [Aeromonas media]